MLHAGALGDCVLTLQLAAAIRHAGYHVSIAARSPIANWAARREMIDEAISLDRLSPLLWGANPLPNGRGSDVCSLFEKVDRIISFLGGPHESVAKNLSMLCGPERVIHIDPRPTENTIRNGIHITKQWAAEIRRHGFDLKFEISDLPFGEMAVGQSPGIALANRHFALSPTHHIARSILVHPGSGGRAKFCPLEALETLVQELLAHGWNARWMIGPDEVERDGPEFRRRLERTAPVIFEESVEAAADCVAAADAFIGNDAGMTHVAALAGVNTVALFGPSDPRVWRPLGSNCTVFRFPSTDGLDRNWMESMSRMIAGNW